MKENLDEVDQVRFDLVINVAHGDGSLKKSSIYTFQCRDSSQFHCAYCNSEYQRGYYEGL